MYSNVTKQNQMIKIWFEKVNVLGADSYGIYDSIELARDLVSEPTSCLLSMLPLHLHLQTWVLLLKYTNQLRDMGFNLLLSVGQGSKTVT